MPAVRSRMPKVRRKKMVVAYRQEMTRILQGIYYSTAGWPTRRLALLLHPGAGKSCQVQQLLPAHLLPPLMHQAAQEPPSHRFPAGVTQRPCQTAPVLVPWQTHIGLQDTCTARVPHKYASAQLTRKTEDYFYF